MPFIQVTWDGTEPPMRHTVSVAGPDADELDGAAALVEPPAAAVLLLLLEPELQPTMASVAAAAPAAALSAADLFLSPIAGTPSALRGWTYVVNPEFDRWRENNWKLSYKIGLLPELNNGRFTPTRPYPSNPPRGGVVMQKPGTPRLLREVNDRAALELLLDHGPLTRSQLSERTGISKVTVSQVLTRLEERGLVTISGEQASGRGPSAALYSVVSSSAYVAGLYVEFDQVSVTVADVTGRSIAHITVDPNGADDPVGMVRDAVAAACSIGGIGLERLTSVVIGSPGVLDSKTGALRISVNLPTWHAGVPDALREVLHTPVTIENDVNLAAMAERADGAAAGLDDFAFVWLGGGLGLATVTGGEVRRGAGGAAGEIGWLPVHGAPLPSGNEHPSKAGLQAIAGGFAVRELAAEHGFSGASAVDAVIRVQAALVSGDGVSGDGASGAREAGAAFFDDLARRVAIGVAAVCVILDPGHVVLGGPVGAAGGTELTSRVANLVPQLCLAHPVIVPTAVTSEPVLAGAMQAALAQARAGLFTSLA
jgi:predicted NBD/HSP70 family sugar kinase